MSLLCLSACLTVLAQPQPEVLCERTQFVPDSRGSLWIISNYELGTAGGKTPPRRSYGLSAVTVAEAGWTVDSVAIYTYRPNKPEAWLRVRRARFNVFAKTADLPRDDEDPAGGREVEVTVRETQKDIYEMRASKLQLQLRPGEYWIGLTPILSNAGELAGHLIVRPARDARFDDVSRLPEDQLADLKPISGHKWVRIGPECFRPLGQFLSLRVVGWRTRRGRVVAWPAEKGSAAKQLHLRFATFDPTAASPKIPTDRMAPGDGNLWIVQHHQTVDQQFRDRLTVAGATLQCYLPDDAYVVRLARKNVDTVRRLEGVRWVGPYYPAYRLAPEVWPESDATGDSARPPRSPERAWRSVLIHLFRRDEAATHLAGQAVRDAGGNVVFQSTRGGFLAANLPVNKLIEVASCDAVSSIERRFKAFESGVAPADRPGGGARDVANPGAAMITLGQIRELCGADALNRAGGFQGSGVRVALWDDGIRTDHVDLATRPVTILGRRQGFVHHATPIASILCGEGRGDRRARGLLPLGGVVLAEEDVGSADGERYGLVERFLRDFRPVVLSSSVLNWGAGEEGVRHYDGYSGLLDDLVSEYDLLVCQAIGNGKESGVGWSGSWSKNAIEVSGVDPHGSLRREDHTPRFTSGPAPDGRAKPDLVHFAKNVFCADASTPQAYAPYGGTSCATPLVAGHCGLMMEMWAGGVFGNLPLGMTVFDRKPHAATAKALMINSAFRNPIGGERPVFTRFDQGWGMPDVGRLYASREKLFVVDQEVALRDHQAVEYQLRVPENEEELRATMVYTDPPGMTAATKALVNDLDLIVDAPGGKRYFGNNGLFSGNASREGGSPDRVNNVENVFVSKPATGVWRVFVAAHRVAAGKHNGAAAAAGQDFGLVVSGVERRPVLPRSSP